jgi:hypothetical protein
MTDETTELTRRWVLRAAGGTATVGATNLTTAAAASDPYDDAEYPSEEWFAREQSNWARTREEPLRELNDPGFQQRWQEQSLINYVGYRRQQLNELEWQRDGNLCRRFTNQCTGDPYLYPRSDLLESVPEGVDAGALADDGNVTDGFDEAAVTAAMDAADADVDRNDIGEVEVLLAGGGPETDVEPAEAAAGGPTDVETAAVPSAAEALDEHGGASLWDGHPFYEEVGDVRRVAFYDSGLDRDEGGARLSGRVWKPTDAEPGEVLPGVVITNGSIQAPETLYWWFAHTLVAAGYVVMTYDPRGQGRSDNETPGGTEGGNFESSVFVTNQVDAIDHFRSTPEDPYQHNTAGVARPDDDVAPVVDYNPFWEYLDRDRLGIAGHSLGAAGVSVVQGMEWPEMAKGESNPVDVAVAWDNQSAAGEELAGRTVTPRVPTMGQSADYFAGVPKTSPPDPGAKLGGFRSWRAARVPSYQVNVRGGTHFEWSLVPTFPATSWEAWGNELADHYSLAWFDFWLRERDGGPGSGQPPDDAAVSAGDDPVADAERRLLAADPWHDRLSFYYTSARYFPSADQRDAWPAEEDDPDGWHVCEDLAAGCE